MQLQLCGNKFLEVISKEKQGLWWYRSLMDGSYRPNPVKRVEIPKDNGKMRLLEIPIVVDITLPI